MKTLLVFAGLATLAASPLLAHTGAPSATPVDPETLRQHMLEDYLRSPEGRRTLTQPPVAPLNLQRKAPLALASTAGTPSLLQLAAMAELLPGASPPSGNGALMAASFAPFKPKVRYYWDATTFYEESDNMPDGMPNRMAGITTWQQQVPLPVAYFANTTNPENATGSLGYKQPNYWRLPLVPTPAATPTLIFTPGSTNNNFQRGAIAVASNGVAIFNPANNTGRVSYEIGELDYYGGHSGMADDYHYHIVPTHLSSRFGGPLSDDKPLAWALDGYPIYGYVEPDGTARQALDSNGGHDIGNGWGYHYHAIGTTTVDATHPYGTPQSPYTMTSFRGTVVNFGGQVDGQPEVSAIRADGTGGYNAKPISGAYIVAFMNPAPLVADGSGHLDLPAGVNLTGCSTTFGSPTVTCASTAGLTTGLAIVGLGVGNNATVTQVNSATQFTLSAPALANTTGQNFTAVSLAGASADAYLMRVNMGGVDYDECWKINRSVNPRTLTMTWRAQALISGQLSGPVVTTTNTYTPNASNPAAVNRLSTYVMSGPSQDNIPDTSQTIDTTATLGEDADYTIHPQSFTDNGNGTVTDNVTGLMWQKVDNGESTWETAVANAAGVNTGGYTDWRLPTPSELFSIFNHNNANPALNTTFFPNNPAGAAEYWWSSDIFGASTTQVWCSNAGGGVGPKPKAETISAGGTFRYHARYVRGKKPTNGHNYQNNGDGTVTDLDTGLMWTQIPGPATTWDAAISYAEGLSTGGYGDWRLPNVKELQTLTDYTLATATGAGAALKPSMNQTMFAKTLTNCVTTAGGTTITCADTTGLMPGMPLVDDSSSDVAGAYIPYATPPTVATVVNGTTFTVNSGTGINAGTGLTFKALPPPTAFWASTSQNNATANAWVVEFGTNTTSSPPRGSQGIISQNVKTASYPVFAVRTTSVATQIAVAQGGNSLTDNASTVGYSAAGSKTFTITNNGVTSLTLNGITVDGANAASFVLGGAPANGTVLAAGASTSFSVQFTGASAGSYSAGLHIACSDPAVGSAFDVTLTGNIPVIGSVAISPSVPSNTDTPYVTAKVTPASGASISQVQLTYNVGTQTTSQIFYETMTAVPYNQPWPGGGALNAWTTVAGSSGQISQTGSGSNRSTPVSLSGCTTTAGSATVTCASTAGLWPGMIVAGANVPTGATVSSVTNSTTFAMSANATGSGSAQTLSAGGMTLTGCSTTSGSATVTCPSTAGLVGATTVSLTSGATTSGSANVTCASTAGLQVGMALTGTGIPNNTVVKTIASGTQFTMSSNATATNSAQTFTATLAGTPVTGSGIPNNTTVSAVNSATQFTLSANATNTNASLTLTAAGCGLQVTKGSATYTDNMVTTTNAIPAAGLSGTVRFYVQTQNLVAGNGWTMQLSPDGGATWNTRASESFGSLTVNLSGCNLASGSTSVTCASTAGLAPGMAVGSPSLALTGCATTNGSANVTCASTAGLVAGMVVVGTGIPSNATVGSITDATHFVLSANATATNSGQTFNAISGVVLTNVATTASSTTVTCASTASLVQGMFVTGVNSIPANTYVSSITNGTTFVLSAAASTTTTAQSLVGTYLSPSATVSSVTDATHFVVSNAPNLTVSSIALAATTANHGYQLYTYALQPGELVNTLKLRFQFSGFNPPAPAKSPVFNVDDISITTTTGVAPVTLAMLDDGLHGDGAANDGVYGVQLPAFAAGTNVTFAIAATDSNSTVTTLASAGSYTTTLPLAVTTASPLPNALTSAPYTQTLVAAGGSGTGYTWSVTAGSLPPGVTLGANGTFSGTASSAGNYSFTATVTDSVGHTASRVFAITSSTPPNILIIVTDDQGWGDIGYHTYPGRVHVDTPTMDSFATSGIRLERFYPTAVCSVTRACLLTGRNSIRTSVNNTHGLDPSEHIMPQTFGAAGYQTYICGKWHIGGSENNICFKTINGQSVRVIQEGEPYRPFNRGYISHYGEYGVIDAFTHYSTDVLQPDKPDWWLNGVQYADSDPTQHTDSQGHGGYATDLLADAAVSRILNRDPAKPLLLHLAFSQIHGPVSAPPDYLAKYGNPSDPTHYISDVPTRTLAASVNCMDAAMGRVLAALDTAGITNNTIVVFMSDNGGENATGGSDLPLRGAKSDPYDGGIRTPAGIRWPGKLAGGLQVTNCVTVAGTTVTCGSTAGLYPGMALAGTGLAYGTTVASVTDGTHFVLSAAPATPSTPSAITITAGVISNQFVWVGDIFPTLCAAAGVTPLNTKPFDGVNLWPALQSITGATPDGTQTRFQTNPDGTKNTTTTNVSPLVTSASPNVGFNTFTDPVSGQTKVFKDIYSPSGGSAAIILTHCLTVAGTAVTCDSTAGLVAGQSVYGTGIKGGTTVASVTDATHFVLSDPPNVPSSPSTITLNVGFPTNQLFNIQDDPYETTDLMLAVNQTALGLNATQITQLNAIVSSLQSAISITPEVYPPYIGPALITNTAAQGSTVQLYVPFTSYAKNAPTVNWRKNGVNLADGGNVSGSTTFTVNVASDGKTYNPGAYTTILTLTNVSPADAGSYDVVINNVNTYASPNVTNTVASPAGTLTVVVGSPVLATLPAFTQGTSQTLAWSPITNATSYTVQAATDVNFASIVASQSVNTTSATFSGLTSGAQYWFRATATDGATTSVFSNTVSSTQDAGNPSVTITAPANATVTSLTSINVQGTASDSLSGVASVTVNGVAATTADNFAHWSATVPLNVGANTITATAADNAQTGGNTGTASISVTLTPNAPVITSVATAPTSPTYLDPAYVLARVTPAPGTTISQVRLAYDNGAPVSTAIFREVFNNTSSNNWNGTGAINAWTTVGAGNVRQAVSTSNHTTPIALASCATTSGSTAVTCASTANLWPGMLVAGTNVPAGAKVASVTNATTFALTANATGTGSGLSLTACGVTLTNGTTTAASTTVTCDSTVGLVAGMSLSGTGLANNATVSSITNATTFVMNAAPTTPGTGLTITASGAAAEFNGGTANLTDSMFTTTNAINTTGTAGYVEFWVQTRDLAATNNNQWAFQVSSDGGATWNTRLSEDWNSETVSLGSCVLNSAGAVGGSTTVTCTSTAGLTTGRNVAGPNVYVTCGLTGGQATVTTASTATLAAGMFLQGTGIPTNARILSVDSATGFTMSANATATGASTAVVATYFASNASVSSITNGTTFVINTAAYVNTSAAPISVSATTVNHGFQLFHYDLAGAELGTNTKLRWQFAGYTPTSPTRSPRVDIDDILVATTAPPPTVQVTMFDDGQHGDGAAGDGLYAAVIPAQAGGTTVNFRVTATDSNNASTTSPTSSSYTYTVSSSLTDATIVNAEHLSVPTDQGITVNAVAASAQDAFLEYGTSPGNYTGATAVATFNTAGVNNVYPIAITLSGLQSNTKYYYRLRHRNAGGTFYNARGERSFRTARPRGSSFVFTLFADPHLDVNTYSDPNDAAHVPQLLNRALDNVAADQPDFHMDLGDILMTDKMALTDGTGIPTYWGGGVFPTQSRVSTRAAIFRSYYERTTHSVPFLGAQGNHEAEYGYLFSAAADKLNNIPAWNLTARRTYFPEPTPGTFFSGNGTTVDYTGGSLGLPQNYFAWEWGDALFVVLDPYWNTMTNPVSTQNAWNWSLGKAQYDWLKATLQNSSASFKFIFMHHIVGGTWTLADGLTSNCAGRGGVEVAPYFEWGGKNIDGSSGFAANRPGWDMPIHDLLVQNRVNVVFHGHDHLYGYQTLDGIVYLECPQPGTANYTQLGSAPDGKYTQGVLLPNSGHIRVTVGPNGALSEYVRAYRSSDENATTHNRDVSHSFAMSPRTFPPIEMGPTTAGSVSFRWNAVPNKPYAVQWSPDLVNWTTIDTVTFTNTNTNAGYTDTNAGRVNQAKGFYRVSYTP